MSDKPILKAAGLLLDQAGAGRAPLDLELSAGQGALVLVRDLDYLRRLMKCCLGLDIPEAGRVEWRQEHQPGEPRNWDDYAFFRRIAYVDRQSQLLGALRLRDHFILFSRYALRDEDVLEESERILDFFELEPYLDFPADALPEPQRRLALYALALCRRPLLMLMERPAQFLDHDFQKVWQLVRERAANKRLAYAVFDRTEPPYASERFDAVLKLDRV